MALTDTVIRNTKHNDKLQKLWDSGGMYLLLTSTGSRLWRLDYRYNNKRKTLSLGTYPAIPLKLARERRDKARELLAQGVDPSAKRKAEKCAEVDTFEAVAREWFTKYLPTWAKTHSSKVIRRMERDVFPWIGSRPISEVSAPELLAALRRIEARGAVDTAHRAHQNCGQIFRYAIATGRATRDPSADLRGAIPPAQGGHYATITDPNRIGDLLRAIETYNGSFITRCALRLAPLLFVRPGELRNAQWSEFDLDAASWYIPAERMKSGAPHIVPLSRQVVAILKELYPLTGSGHYLFPSVRASNRSMSDNTLNAALRYLGYDRETITGHGFRGMASTLLNEQGWHRDAIERQLAHGERNKVRAAYNHAEYMPERKKMMQAWGDYLEGLRKNRKVVPIKRSKTA